jgi:hypothetical protein
VDPFIIYNILSDIHKAGLYYTCDLALITGYSNKQIAKSVERNQDALLGGPTRHKHEPENRRAFALNEDDKNRDVCQERKMKYTIQNSKTRFI